MARNGRERHQALNKGFPNTTQRTALETAITKQVTSYLTASVTATSSTTLTAATDTTLEFNGPGQYTIKGTFPLSIANAAHNLKFDFNGGTITNASALASSVSGFARLSLANGTALVVPITALNTSIDGSTSNAWVLLEVEMFVTLVGPGTIVMEYAQSASGASNSTVSGGVLRAQGLA